MPTLLRDVDLAPGDAEMIHHLQRPHRTLFRQELMSDIDAQDCSAGEVVVTIQMAFTPTRCGCACLLLLLRTQLKRNATLERMAFGRS